MQTSKVRFSASEIDRLCKIQHLRVLFQTVLSFQPLTTLKQSFTDIFLNRCSWKFRISHKKYLCWSLFLIKLQISFYSKETPTQFLSCEYCDIFKNSFFKEHLWRLLLTTLAQSSTLDIWLSSGYAFVGGNSSFPYLIISEML